MGTQVVRASVKSAFDPFATKYVPCLEDMIQIIEENIDEQWFSVRQVVGWPGVTATWCSDLSVLVNAWLLGWCVH